MIDHLILRLATYPQDRGTRPTTGLAWGHAALSLKPKDGPLRTVFIRYTWTFAKTDGQWREVAVHSSLIPSGN
jgi:hypothetical protein